MYSRETGHSRISRLLVQQYVRTLKIRSLVVPWGIMLIALAEMAFLIGVIVLYTFYLPLDAFEILIYATVFVLGLPFIPVILWHRPDLWYRMNTRSLAKHMQSDDRRLYQKHIDALSSLITD